jgi:hypothetical protein
MSHILCQTFKELARATWRRLKSSTVTGLPWGEVTNTETLLAELVTRHPRSVRIHATPRLDETLNGSDWEWWIGEPGAWLGMRVQAKRLNIRRQRFMAIRTQKPRSAADTQMTTLIKQAAADGLTPAYCFYVYSPRWPWSAIWMAQDLGRSEPEVCGCIFGHASAVRATKSESLDKISQVCMPWHYLVCSDSDDAATQAERVRGLLHRSAASGDFTGLLASPDNEVFPLSNVTSRLPDYLFNIVASSENLYPADSDADLAGRTRSRGLAGYVLINTSPDGVWEQ